MRSTGRCPWPALVVGDLAAGTAPSRAHATTPLALEFWLAALVSHERLAPVGGRRPVLLDGACETDDPSGTPIFFQRLCRGAQVHGRVASRLRPSSSRLFSEASGGLLPLDSALLVGAHFRHIPSTRTGWGGCDSPILQTRDHPISQRASPLLSR